MRNDFKKWLSKYSKDYIKTVLSYLDRYLSDYPIRDQKDVFELINSVSFDSRIIHVNLDEVWDYLDFRQKECWRNHLNSYAFYTLLKEFGDKRRVQEFLKGKKSAEIHDLLFQRGINLAKTPSWQRRGIIVHWKEVELEKEFNGRVVRYKRRKIVENWNPPIFGSEEGKKFVEEIIKNWRIT
jgi:tRNA(His) 5'-end guanylyltransferase